MLESLNLTNVLFLDIETVSSHKSYHDLSDKLKALWDIKTRQILRIPAEEVTEELAIETFEEKAGIYAEFGKIVCISVGFVSRDSETKAYTLRLKSYASDDEKVLLTGFAELLDKHYNNPTVHYLCGHNIKEFDVPYMCRRMVVLGLALPSLLNIPGKKPWELNYLLDTMTLWKFGDYKSYSSLSLLTAIFDIPSPKDDINGSEVGRVYWQEDDLERIAIYCEKDVIAVAQLLCKYKRLDLIPTESIIHVPLEIMKAMA